MGTGTTQQAQDRNARRGLGLRVDIPPEVIREAAIAAQDHGYASFWLNNPPRSKALDLLGGIARVATRIHLGVGVIPLSDHRPGDIVHQVRQNAISLDRLYLGVGSGSGAGAVERVAEGIRAIRSDLECCLVIAALGPRMCRLAGAEADGVLFNWLTPQWALHSAQWVREGANRAGKPMPRTMAYVRAARGPEAIARLQREAANYAAIPHYHAHFERMGTPAFATAITGETPGDIQRGLSAWDGVVDEVIVRVVAASDTAEHVTDLVRAARPIA
jgi:alkanesulfonate monooxygenase SsuD/methylene tetrahydromethanopterin reductase-like flavin-dependent oxidoreductase (luciferase family)